MPLPLPLSIVPVQRQLRQQRRAPIRRHSARHGLLAGALLALLLQLVQPTPLRALLLAAIPLPATTAAVGSLPPMN